MLLNTTTGSVAGQTQTYTTTASAPAGSVVVVAQMTHGQTNAALTDSTGQTWTARGETGSSNMRQNMWKCIVGAGGMPSGTTLTITWPFSGANSTAIVATCFTDGTSIPTASDGSSVDGTNATNISQTVTGPTAATSYQYVAQSYSNNNGTGPDSGTTGGWALDQTATTAESPGYGMKTYWRKATDTSSTLLKTTAGGFSLTGTQWQEIGAP